MHFRAAAVVVCLLTLVSSAPLRAQLRAGSDEGRDGRERLQSWLTAWLDESTATLKSPLYSLEFTMVFFDRPTTSAHGIVRLSPKLGLFYAAELPSPLSDSEPFQMLTASSPASLQRLVAARTAVLRVNRERIAVRPPRLIRHEVGTQWVIDPTVWDNGVSVSLYDPAIPRPTTGARQFSDAATSFEIVYVNDLRGTAREAAEIKALIARVVSTNRPAPAYGSAPGVSTSLAPLGLNGEAYQVIVEGMRYEDVADIIGRPGELAGSSMIGGLRTAVYIWRNKDGGNMNATFQNGLLVSKAQFGLR